MGIIDKGVKILEDAAKKFGNLPEVHRQLIKVGVEVSHTTLYNAASGVSRSLKPEVIVGLCHLVYSGDWSKMGRALEVDFMASGLKR